MPNVSSEELAELAAFRARNPGAFGGPTNARRAGGRKAVRAGSEWEAVCTAPSVHATVTRIPNGMKVIGHKGDRPIMVAQPSPFDYAGTLRVPEPGGGFRPLPVFFDAKSFGEKHATCPLSDPRLFKPHQFGELAAQRRAGAVAGFLVRSERAGAVVWLDALRAEELRGARLAWDSPAWVRLGEYRGRVPWEVLIVRYA